MPEKKKGDGLFERDGAWWIRWRDREGKEKIKRVGSHTAAKALRKKLVEERMRRKLFPHQRRPVVVPTVEEAMEAYLAGPAVGKHSYRDDVRHARMWSNLLGELRLDEVTAADIDKLKWSWAKTHAAQTINNRLGTLRRVMSLAVRDGVITQNAVKQSGQLKTNNARVRYLSDDEEAALRAAFPDRWWHRVEMAFHTGLRQSEQHNLKWSQVDWNAGILTIPRSKHGEARRVPMNSRVVAILRELKAASTSEWVFLGPQGGRNLRNWIARVWERAVAESGIQDFCWHDLRHTCASRLVMAGVDIYDVKEIMGHKTIRMTERYAHLAPHRLRADVEKLVR